MVKLTPLVIWICCGVLPLAATAQVQQAPRKTGVTERPIELTPLKFKEAVESGKHRLVDVRTPAEFATGRIAGADNIDWSSADYETAFKQLDPKVPVLLYCHGGGRSEQALEYLVGKGYQVQHLEGGITAWRRAGLPVVK